MKFNKTINKYLSIINEEKDIWDLKDAISRVLSQYQPNQKQKWNVIPFLRLKKIWEDYAKLSFVRDTKGMQKITDLIIDNIEKINANTILAGHTAMDPDEYFNNYGFETDEDKENFWDSLEDENGQLRISDYALDKLIDLYFKLSEADSAEQQLQIVDRILNVVHQRSDIAGWFIEGGTKSLNILSDISDLEVKYPNAPKNNNF